jgi:predicted amidohydrolase YtcJ
MLHEPAFYYDVCQKAYDAGFQVAIHAIGDSATRFVLDMYAHFLQGRNDRRWRIEHAQVVHPADFEKFATYSIIPSIQSTHATSDMLWAPGRLGRERLKGAYAQQELLKQNAWLINGTDFPIEGIDPLQTFFAAVFRKDEKGHPEGGFLPEQALSRKEALQSMTIWAAKGSFEEDIKGSIELGKHADFVMLNRDIMTAEESEILKATVLSTFVHGERVFQKE